jgi:diguanylate cyclase (GGDEF)-like protein/PAS domain S-box-containing protein
MTVARHFGSLRSWLSILYAAARGDARTIAAMREEEFRILAGHSMDLILRVGRDLRPSYVSPSCQRLLGYAPEELLARSAQELVLEEDLSAWENLSSQVTAGSSERVSAEIRILAKNGVPVWMEASAQMIGTSGSPEAILVLRDISERKRLDDSRSANTGVDERTGLLDRHAFHAILEKEWRRAVRNGSKLSLLLVGVDHVQQYDDLYGRAAREACFREVAEAVRSVVQRSGDAVAQYGAEECAAVLPETDLAGAISVGEEIRKQVRAAGLRFPAHPDGKQLVTVSIGAASVQAIPSFLGHRMPESLVMAAEEALRKADKGGRDAVYTAAVPGPDGGELTA